jgi:hypothetical protein
MRRPAISLTAGLWISLGLSVAGCGYLKLPRPSVLKPLNPRVVALVNELPAVDDPNEDIVARLFPHGGLSHAKLRSDGVFRDEIRAWRTTPVEARWVW